jgi:hypothetical protein
MDHGTEIPVYVLRTLEPEGYARRFWEFVQASAFNHREAFEALEDERERFGLPHRYNSYESFRARAPHRALIRLLE